MIVKLSLACALSTLIVAIVVASAAALPPKTSAQATGWVTRTLTDHSTPAWCSGRGASGARRERVATPSATMDSLGWEHHVQVFTQVD